MEEEKEWKKYKFINVPMNKKLYRQIRMVAAEKECSSASLLRQAIEEYLEKYLKEIENKWEQEGRRPN